MLSSSLADSSTLVARLEQPNVPDSSNESARLDPQSARLERRVGSSRPFGVHDSTPRLLDSSAESSNLGHESSTRQTDSGHESRTESDDRPPDSVRERGRELRQKCPTRDPHEGSSRTEFALWARSYL